MKAFLKSSEGIFVLRPKITTLGRHEDSDIILKSPNVDDRHAAIEFKESENVFVLRDFNSAQGTFVNDCHIQNAAVKISPGDVLRFGSSRTGFELMVESASQEKVSCPPVMRRAAWPGLLQIVTETATSPAAASQFPFLQSHPLPHASSSWTYGASGTSPHPPLRKRPINAWGRVVASPSFAPSSFSRPPTDTLGNGTAAGPLSSTHYTDSPPKDKDELVTKTENEASRLSSHEGESSRKDAVISNLQDELAVVTEKMVEALARKEAVFNQKLQTLGQDVEAKTEEIKALKERVSYLQQNTSEVLCHSLSERDLQIAHWKQEIENLKKNNSLTSGLVTSLQKDVTSKEQKIQQLKTDAEKLRREIREKDSQLAHVSAQRVAELELQVKRAEEEIQKGRAEQGTLTKRLAEKAKAAEELQKECERKSQQLQEMRRRERLAKSDLEAADVQAQHFRSQIIESLFSQLPEMSVSDQQIMEKISEIKGSTQGVFQMEKLPREEIHLKTSKEEAITEQFELLKESLDGLQTFLKTSYCSSSLRKEVCSLQNLCLTPPVSWIQSSAAEVLCSLLSWVDAVERLLLDVGLDISDSEKGMTFYMKKLLNNHLNTTGKLQMVQTQLRMAEESQHSLLWEKMNEVKAGLQKEFQDKEQMFLNRVKVLEETAGQEKEKLNNLIEKEKKKVQDLKTQMGQLAEVTKHKTELEEALNAKLIDTLESLEETERRKVVAEEKLTIWEKRLKSLESEKEIQKQKHQEEFAEYKEQIKQHSRTIVAMEGRLSEAAQYLKKVKEENLRLRQQIEEMQRESSKSKPSILQEVSKPSVSQEVSKPSISQEFSVPLVSQEVSKPSVSQEVFMPSRSQEVSCTKGDYFFMMEKLASARQEVLSKHTIILELKKELSEAKARMSDIIGELSEKQKMELEQKRSLVLSQAQELNHLQEKLYEMSKLVDRKDANLNSANEELRNSREKLKELKAEVQRKASLLEKSVQHKSSQTNSTLPEGSPATRKVSALDLADMGAKCKGYRHEETILRQKDALTELRERIKVLERSRPLGFKEKTVEPLIVLKKDLTEKSDRKTEKEHELSLVTSLNANKLQNSICSMDPNVAIERTAKLEMADALDLSENMYLTLIRDLSSLLDTKELLGMQTVKHLPHDEREKVGLLRQKDLEGLFDKVRRLKNRLERKEELLKEYEKDVGKFRTNTLSLQTCQAEMAKLADRIYQEAEENTLLKEALERTKVQLIQEKKLNRVLKQHKAAVKKKLFPENQKMPERPVEACKKRTHCSASA
ncbi:forkhead-associated domain-containing protein 1 isoform X2 [Sphaerodactylus townsendi]|uniref:forkhead-associated domain-containing protein 1 isoform X2 n=1 Tax=Sphaerodactylus townsendi TaxID=933632 RepID=UPI00202734CA|nr:forkhead-associated domain-containing protein 1 isoform X2 [Sphaerodactylus townsendi]